jgi:hypothetical protein
MNVDDLFYQAFYNNYDLKSFAFVVENTSILGFLLCNREYMPVTLPISIVNGSSILNDKIFDFVKKCIGEDKIKSAKFTDIKRILNEIEDQKKNLNNIASENMELNIEGLGITCSTGSILSWSKNKECEKEIEGKKFSYTDKILFIPKEYVNEMILETTITIKHLIDSILVKMQSTDLIIFTGDLVIMKFLGKK